MRDQVSHTVSMHTIEFIMCRSYKIAFYMALLSAVDGEITTSGLC